MVRIRFPPAVSHAKSAKQGSGKAYKDEEIGSLGRRHAEQHGNGRKWLVISPGGSCDSHTGRDLVAENSGSSRIDPLRTANCLRKA